MAGGVDRMSSSLKGAFYPGLGRAKPAPSLRTVSMVYPGRNDRFPGEGLIQFDPPPDILQRNDSGGTAAAIQDGKSEETTVHT
ncbi:hypothetical protein BV22DRAFT_1029110 [Leucogyrophana mollusca]|uniref:Uncharacterized protein n=1 Tax=Leucogyrophana mollusca TaxID=85980 RepID=A0ACB8BVH7_9AGAM|nr:hypothetical protein BV22DRAFT_1029110 [Leucogyrophana mollusca]